MNILKQLQEKQNKLDNYIIEKQGLQGKDLLKNKIIALDVELSEFMNEIESFKFWKINKGKDKALEEACDCLHFILSIANDLNVDLSKFVKIDEIKFGKASLETIYMRIKIFINGMYFEKNKNLNRLTIRDTFKEFIAMLFLLNIKFNDLVKEYNKKYEINIKRQNQGY